MRAYYVQSVIFFRACERANKDIWDWNIRTDEAVVRSLCCTMLGYDPSERSLHDRTFLNLLHSDDIVTIQQLLNEYFEGKQEAHELALRIQSKSGDMRRLIMKGKFVERNTTAYSSERQEWL